MFGSVEIAQVVMENLAVIIASIMRGLIFLMVFWALVRIVQAWHWSEQKGRRWL